MWDTPFDTSMLDASPVVINCPNEDVERDLAAILTSFGIVYSDGSSLLRGRHWDRYGEDFCYYVKGSVAYRGSKSSTQSKPWSSYTKTTFFGDQIDEDISDESFEAILGR